MGEQPGDRCARGETDALRARQPGERLDGAVGGGHVVEQFEERDVEQPESGSRDHQHGAHPEQRREDEAQRQRDRHDERAEQVARIGSVPAGCPGPQRARDAPDGERGQGHPGRAARAHVAGEGGRRDVERAEREPEHPVAHRQRPQSGALAEDPPDTVGR